MVICLVTDRRRLGAAMGAPESSHLELLTRQIVGAAAAGIDLVQVRESDLDARALTTFVRSVATQLRGSHTKILVNDRLDVALAAGAHGVHLKESSFPPEVVRTRSPQPFVVTCAVHTPFTAAARRSADFLVAGTVLPTVSKSRADYLEWKGLGEVVGAANATPVLAIGGLDLESIPSLAASGAAGLAAIGAFIPPTGNTGLEEFLKKRVTDMRFAFDSAQSRP
jgi:thiamine-phosphate diphosphorylase